MKITVGETDFKTLDEALEHIDEENLLVDVPEEIWSSLTPLYFDGNFYSNFNKAIEATNESGEDAIIYVRPDCEVPMGGSHLLIKTNLTIYGNGSRIADVSGDFTVGGDSYIDDIDARYLYIYNLDNCAIWNNSNVLGINNLYSVYLFGCNDVRGIEFRPGGTYQGTLNLTVNQCKFNGNCKSDTTGIDVTYAGKVTLRDSVFYGCSNGVSVDNKNNVNVILDIADCLFEDCSKTSFLTNIEKAFSAPVRVVSSCIGGSVDVNIENIEFKYADNGRAYITDILLGDGRATSGNAGSIVYHIEQSSARLIVYEPRNKGEKPSIKIEKTLASDYVYEGGSGKNVEDTEHRIVPIPFTVSTSVVNGTANYESVEVYRGSSLDVIFTPTDKYNAVKSATINGEPVEVALKYGKVKITLENIKKDYNIEIEFDRIFNKFNVSATVENGSVDNESAEVTEDDDFTLTFTPEDGFSKVKVYVNDVRVPASFEDGVVIVTLEEVAENYEVSVVFMKEPEPIRLKTCPICGRDVQIHGIIVPDDDEIVEDVDNSVDNSDESEDVEEESEDTEPEERLPITITCECGLLFSTGTYDEYELAKIWNGRVTSEVASKSSAKRVIISLIRHSKHKWKLDENGEIDTFAWNFEYHNGVECVICGERKCVHCGQDYETDEICTETKRYCPTCGGSVMSGVDTCIRCGQKLDIKNPIYESDENA